MNIKKLACALPLAGAMLMGCSNGNVSSFRYAAKEEPLSNPKIDKLVDGIYNRMTQEERIAQLHGVYLHDLQDENGHLDPEKCRKLIPNGVGHFSQYASNASPETDPDRLRDMVAEAQQWLKENTTTGTPALFHEEVLSGVAAPYATTYPQQIGIACSFNPDLVEAKTRYTARNMRDIGGFLSLSPMVDVSRNPSFNRNEESYGEDSYLIATLGTAFVRGLQDGGLEKGVATTSKHFLGYGSGYMASDKEMMEEILLPHEAMIRTAGSKVVMTGYHEYHGTKCVINHELAEGLLRDYLGFDGVMVSDYGSIDQFPMEKTEDVLARRAALAIGAGNDVEFAQGRNYSHIQEAIDAGLMTQEQLETAVKRVLVLKARLGLLDENPVLYKEGHITFDTPEERQVAYELATQSVVMLENNGILPLKGDACNVMLTGPNANQMWAMVGDYTYQAMVYFWHHMNPSALNPKISLLKEAMESKLPQGWSLTYERGCDWTEANETKIENAGDARALAMLRRFARRVESGETNDWNAAIAKAAKSDVIVAAMGENVLLCGENRDRGGLGLPGRQKEYVEALIATGKPVVLILFGGRAQVLGDLADRCAAVIQAWYPGEEGGNALADILYGKVSPSGKLSVSYPKVEIYDENICYNTSVEQDARIQYPFGYGLSYSSFEYSALAVDSSVKTSAEKINISFTVTNSGEAKADEIAQIYLCPTSADQAMKPIQLHGYGRVSLAPGESKTLSFIMSPQELGHYTEAGWEILPGKYSIKIGASSQDIRLASDIELTGKAVHMPLRSVYFTEQID